MKRPTGFEVRAFGLTGIEHRRRLFEESGFADLDLGVRDQEASDTAGTISGWAALFGSRSVDLGGFTEEINPGAFRRSLASSRDLRALWAHDAAAPLARRANRTLRMWEDHRGLAFEADVPKTDLGLDTLRLVRRGDLDGMSFGFSVPEGGDTWKRQPDGTFLRTLHEVNLVEVSVVSYPAYLATSVSVGSHRSHRLAMLERSGDRGRLARLRAREESIARDRRLRLLERTA